MSLQSLQNASTKFKTYGKLNIHLTVTFKTSATVLGIHGIIIFVCIYIYIYIYIYIKQ